MLKPIARPFINLSILAIGCYLIANIFLFFPAYLQLFSHKLAPISSSQRPMASIAEAQRSREAYCLLLGTSSVRRGVNTGLMNQLSEPLKLRFFNLATDGESILEMNDVINAIKVAKLKPECLLIGVNPSMMNGTNPPRELSFNAQRYQFWPWNRIARRVNNIVRYGLFKLQSKLLPHLGLTLKDFELNSGDLQLSSLDFKFPTQRIVGKIFGSLDQLSQVKSPEEQGYSATIHLETLRSLADQLNEISPIVIFYHSPMDKMSRDLLSRKSMPKFYTLLDGLAGPTEYLNLNELLSDELLYDHLHPTERGGSLVGQALLERVIFEL